MVVREVERPNDVNVSESRMIRQWAVSQAVVPSQERSCPEGETGCRCAPKSEQHETSGGVCPSPPPPARPHARRPPRHKMAEVDQQFPQQSLPLPHTTTTTATTEDLEDAERSYSSDETSRSPARPSKSPDLPEETSGEGLPGTDGGKGLDGEKALVSSEMEEEESKLEAENREEEERLRSSLREEREKENAKEQRYKRLMHLLSKSQFYSEFLLKQIKSQKAASKERPKSSQEGSEASSSQSDGSGGGSQESQGSGGGKRKRGGGGGGGGGGKRRKEDKSYQITDVIDEDTVKRHAEGAREEEEEGEAVERVKQPRLFENGVMRPYQLDGFSWLQALYLNGINGILGDEMGLGKTIQCIALICHLVEQGVSGPFLVVAPLSTLPNWMSEFERFAPKVPTLLYHGPESDRMEKRRLIKRVVRLEGCPMPVQPVVVTSYEVAIRDTRVLQQYTWRYVCVDEGHRLKNHKCRLTKSLNSFTDTNRLLLTGTPLQNSLAELWALLNFLMPDIFDSLDVFESWFDVTEMLEEGSNERIIQEERENQVISTLMKILSPFFLRRVKKDVDLGIPPKRELLVYTPMTSLQVKLYEATLTHNVELFDAMKRKEEEDQVEYDEKGRPKRKAKRAPGHLSLYLTDDQQSGDEEEEVDRLRTFFQASMKSDDRRASQMVAKSSQVRVRLQNKMMQLRRIVNHPYLIEYPLNPNETFRVDEGLVESCGKLQVLDQLLGELFCRGHRVLLFTQMTSLMDILEDYLTLRPQYRYRRLDGKRKLEERQSDIRDFNQAGSDDFLFLLSTRAGGLGLNLATADTVIIYDSDWNPQCDLQAQDRCHRIGQTNPVLVLRLITASSIDERIVERAAMKRKLEKLIIQSGKFRAANQGERTFQQVMNEGELLALLKERDHEREHRASKGHVFTQKELDQLLDRTDLTSAGKRRRRKEEGEEEKKLDGVFKVILEED
ncbi:lymphocyte-specific helicase-like [Eriocheir sinensis]|uniref:lymphocyte-specific helicase-like n=1 Tax=Eriocheir sinensis TaxID=95602 RepID=UPI0021C99903|nr:lymphocyte-specific helicase-like [Eriocheir sinensis]